jgi:endonuclease YncB( thermonuclease family)
MFYWRRICWSLPVAALLSAAMAGYCRAQEPVRCGLQEIAAGQVGRVIDGRTFGLGDGREVRLAGIEVPALLRSGAPDPDGSSARDALAALLASGRLVLRQAKAAADRYGRMRAYATIMQDRTEHSVQAQMLAQGHAWVSAPIGDPNCAADLKRNENAARKAKLGLWADPYYGIKQAEHPADIDAGRGRFALVEGKVLSVRESGATIYVNFGRRWSQDFTVTILKRNRRKFTAAGIAPKSLAGRRVRVRGWIEERGGPWIEAMYPEQIELAVGD